MLEVKELACIRGDQLLFDHLSFKLAAGGLLYILGTNGAGKSSLLRLICGLLPAEAGDIYWRNENIRQAREIYQSELLYIGHLNGLKDDLTALENLHMSARLAGGDVNALQSQKALEDVGLAQCLHLPVRVLSQGQKRRVSLARIWLTKAKLWVLDEPFAALDASTIVLLADKLGQHLLAGGMVILTTHQEVAIRSADEQTLRLGAQATEDAIA